MSIKCTDGGPRNTEHVLYIPEEYKQIVHIKVGHKQGQVFLFFLKIRFETQNVKIWGETILLEESFAFFVHRSHSHVRTINQYNSYKSNNPDLLTKCTEVKATTISFLLAERTDKIWVGRRLKKQ